MAIYSGFTMIYPLKVVIFHSYVSFPEATCCEKQQVLHGKKYMFQTLRCLSSPTAGFFKPRMENHNMNKTANIHRFDYDDISG